MEKKSVLLGVFLGLLTFVQTSPVSTVTQIPTRAEDEVLREAVTDGFLVDPAFHSDLTTERPTSSKAVSASPQQPASSAEPEKEASGEGIEESSTPVFIQDGGDHNMTTAQTVSHASSTDSPTNPDPESAFISSSPPNEGRTSVAPDHSSSSPPTDPAVSTFDLLSTLGSYSGSGDGEDPNASSTVTFVSSTEASNSSSTSETGQIRPRLFEVLEGSGSDNGTEPAPSTTTTEPAPSTTTTETIITSSTTTTETITTSSTTTTPSTNVEMKNAGDVDKLQRPPEDASPSPNVGDRTPSWIIILGFVVGVAALVMLCVAIATRHKWNGPSQVSHPETKTRSSNQQRGLEMETFLHKEEPLENGKAAEYTVIPLDEIPDDSTSR